MIEVFKRRVLINNARQYTEVGTKYHNELRKGLSGQPSRKGSGEPSKG